MSTLKFSFIFLLIFVTLSSCCDDDQPPTICDVNIAEFEDCISYDPTDLAIEPFGSAEYRIIEGGNNAMFIFPNLEGAEEALEVMIFYQLNQSCFVGRPGASFFYQLKDGGSPVGALTGEDCVSFDPNNIEVEFISGTWKIVDDNHWLFDFGENQEEACEAYAVMKEYGFTKSCFVGRPDPTISYLRK